MNCKNGIEILQTRVSYIRLPLIKKLGFCFLFFLILTSDAMAASWLQMRIYAGGEFKFMWTDGTWQFRGALAKSYPGGTAFIGAKFSDYFGLETGFCRTTERHRSRLVNNRTNKVGAKFTTMYFDVNIYWPLMNCWELIGSGGIATMKGRVRTIVGPTQSLIQGRNGYVWRFGGGVHYMVTEILGIRSIARWENTSKFRIQGNKIIKDSATLTVGVFFRF